MRALGLAGLVLGVSLAGAADDPPGKPLTPEDRTALGANWEKRTTAATPWRSPAGCTRPRSSPTATRGWPTEGPRTGVGEGPGGAPGQRAGGVRFARPRANRLRPAARRAGTVFVVGSVAFGDPPAGPPSGTGPAAPRGEPPVPPGRAVGWADLPAAVTEAKQVAARVAGRRLDAVLLSGREASADRVLAELPRARFAPLATHGFFAGRPFRSVLQVDPARFERDGGDRVGEGALSPLVMSGLVLAGANRPETPGRGLVTGEHLVDRDLSDLELAVVSACDTGLGDVPGGAGVFGLQRAFHLAGCRNVVVGVWKVPDAATAALMGEFYMALWDDGLPPVLALQKAQLAVYRADSKTFAEMALRGPGMGDKDFDAAKAAVGKLPVGPGGRNPPVVWAAWTLSGPGR